MPADHLGPTTIEWAKNHLEVYGDTDIFPIPFEYQAIRHDWCSFRAYLRTLDLNQYRTKAYNRCLVPKVTGGYRTAIQLDPVDTIVYTSLAYECAELIENCRAPVNVACSYRVELDDHNLFEQGNPWKERYQKTSKTYAQSGEFSYVVLADISDFYNQISHHRISNNLETAGTPSSRTSSIENFLFSLTNHHHSRGVPVGPVGSILLAEASLIDVDNFLLGKSYAHVRYVDDFRVFCHSKKEAQKALYELAEYLYTSHRLTFQSNKTFILPLEIFCKKEFEDPEDLENTNKEFRINAAIQEFIDATGYLISEEDLEPSEKLSITLETLQELFEYMIRQNPLHLGLSRYVLRRARILGAAKFLPIVLNNLEKLSPVFRDVILYILRSINGNVGMVGNSLTNFLEHSEISFLPFLQGWCLHAFVQRKDLLPAQKAFELVARMNSRYSIRFEALLAREYDQLHWIREKKENWQDFGPWDKRAILWSGKILREDERKHWLSNIARNHEDVLVRAVAKAVKEGL